MIIKRKRIKAKGTALKRVLKHLSDGEDNESVELLQGNIADLEDARQDAIRLGREYGLRHWILSPERDLTIEQFLFLLALLAEEFGFDARLAAAWKHGKPRASGDVSISAEHYHVLVREVDAVSGAVLSTAHDFKRQEKISRIAEVRWGAGHRLTPGAHNRSVASFLIGGENNDVAAAMVGAGLLTADRPSESFTEADQQRAKREGLDLPQLAFLIREALARSSSQKAFDANLAALGLRLRPGEKPGTPIVETLGQELVGSLARLTKLRKAALLKRMQFDGHNSTATITGPQEAAGKPAATAGESAPGNPSLAQNADQQDEPSRGAGEPGDRSGPAGPDRHHDPAPTEVDRRHGPDPSKVGRSGSALGRSDAADHAGVIVALGCATNQNVLLDLLATARRASLAPLERVLADLDESIEANTGLIDRPAVLREPDSLVAARKVAQDAKDQVRILEAKATEISQKLAVLPPSTLWRRFWYRLETKRRTELDASLVRQNASLRRAEIQEADAQRDLATEETTFRIARIEREAEAVREAETAKLAIPIAQAAKTLVLSNNHLALGGSMRLIEMARKIEQEKKALLPDFEETEEMSYALRT